LKGLWGYQQFARGAPLTVTSTPRLAVEHWIRELASAPPLKGKIPILAIRNETWIEWAVYCACWMRKLGYAPILIYSPSEIRRIYEAPGLYNRFFYPGLWRCVARIPDLRLVSLDEEQPTEAQAEAFRSFARDYAPTVAAREMRVEEHEGGALREEYLAQTAAAEGALSRAAAAFVGILRRLEADGEPPLIRRLLAYSGLIGVTPAAHAACRGLGWEAAFVEGWLSRPGHMIVSLNAPALQYDIPGWFRALGDWDERRAADLEQFVRFQEVGLTATDVGDTEWLQDYHRVQQASAEDELPEPVEKFLAAHPTAFLLATNVVGDSATLRSATIFRSQRHWLSEVLPFFGERPELGLIVRAHPDELWLGAKIVERMGDLAAQFVRGALNILILKGSDRVSSYALIRRVRAGLVWMSTIGVDMVTRGLPAIAAARPKYSGLGIVREPSSRQEYFDLVLQLARRPARPSLQQLEMGKRYLYILSKELTFQAFGPVFRGRDLTLGGHPAGGECETFYRCLAGELPIPSRPPARAAGEGRRQQPGA
jgi:hypothetical protein